MTVAHPHAAPLDTTGDHLYAQADELRALGPAVRVALPGDLTAWSVTRGDVVKRLATDPRVSRDPSRHWPGFTYATQPGWLVAWTPPSMFNTDGADHVRLRRLIARAFTARQIESLRPAVTEIVTRLLATLDERSLNDITDLRADFCGRIPTTVICDLFGVPPDEQPRMQHIFDGVMNTAATSQEAAANSAEMVAAIRDLIAYKQDHPGSDMTSQLLAIHEAGGDRLSEPELVATLILMVGAGSETTRALLDHAIVALLADPESLARIRGNPALWNDAVEETLRLHPPIMHIPMRYAVEDIELDGLIIRKGDLILLGFGAYGRDPAVHNQRDSWNLDREDKDHLAFGFGPHFCLGAPLARLEAVVALPALFDRFPDMTLAVRPEKLPRIASFIANDYSALPVHLHGPG